MSPCPLFLLGVQSASSVSGLWGFTAGLLHSWHCSQPLVQSPVLDTEAGGERKG